MTFRSYFILALVSFLLAFSSKASAQNNGLQAQIPANEYNALVDLYNGAGGANWTQNTGWNDASATSWFGVTVTGVQFDPVSGDVTQTGNVTAIALGSNNLIGNIPDSISALTALTSLDLSGNQLTGTLSASIESLPASSTLSIGNNDYDISNGSANLTTINAAIANSITVNYTPQNPGSLQVTISPAGAITAGAQWQVDGGSLQNSGDTVNGLSAGSHTVTFTDVTGYTTPTSQQVTISSGQTASASGTYVAIPQSGSLQVTLSPSDAVTNGAQWQVDGGALQNSGDTVSGLSVGSHTVTFTDVTGYTTPTSQQVTINASQTTTATGTYVLVVQTGSLQVTLSPAGAITAGAQWAVDSGSPQNSGATVSGLSVGSHTVTFTDVTGYTTPTSQQVTINASQTTNATGTYVLVVQTGSLQVTLSPAGAITAGAQWAVDSGSPQNSGATVSGLSVGSHTLTFTDVTGYTTPTSQQVTINASQTTNATGTYVLIPQTGSLAVTLSPTDAVTNGAQWQVDGGALQNSGATVSGLSVGSHTVTFTDVTGYTTPTSQQVTINASQTTTATGTYVLIPQTGSLAVTLSPTDAVTNGAQWQVDGGALQNSGATVSGLSVGSHTLTFTDVTGYTTPTSQQVTINASQTTTATGTYVATAGTGSLQVALAPAGAITSGARWTVDGGALQASGATVAGLSTGSHTVAFTTIDGYTTPTSQQVTINASQTTNATGTYVATGTAATVTLSGLAATYNGLQHSVVAKTKPAGLPVDITYNGSSTAPTNAGSYTVIATISDGTHTGAAQGTLVINKAVAKAVLGSLAATYDTNPHAATATTTPVGLNVTFTYAGSATAPTAAGSYAVIGTVTDPNHTGTAKGTLVIKKGTATVTLGNLAATYDATPHAATATTNPNGLTVTLTYNKKATLPVAVGSYAVAGTVTDTNYTGTATGTLVIGKAAATVTLGGLAATYTGKAIAPTVTTNPPGLPVTFAYTVAGKKASPVAVGSYAVTATINSPNAAGTASDTLVISPAAATIQFTQLAFAKTGKPILAKATTVPAGLAVVFTYDGSSTAPINVGDYNLVATINNANYTGTNNATMVIAQTLPTSTTAVATLVGARGATLNGSVNPNNAAVNVFFQYGVDTTYGNTTAPQSIASGSALVKFSAAVGSLAPMTTYHFRAVAVLASDASAVVFGKDLTFKTLAVPTAITTPQAALAATGAQAYLSINPNGVATTAYFEYSALDTSYNLSTTHQSLGSGKVPVNFSAFFSGLLPNTLYHYRLVLTGPWGTIFGDDQTFTTIGFDTTLVAQKGDAAAGTASTFTLFGPPAVNAHDGVAFTGTLTAGAGITTANNIGIWADDNTLTRVLVAQIGSAAPGTGGNFLTLTDPVYDDNGDVAFRATLKVLAGQVTASNATGIWSTSSGSLQLVARQGSAAPGTTGTFATFTSLGMTQSAGAIFYATLNAGAGITTANNAGIWEGNTAGDLTLVLQLGQVVGGKTITKITYQPILTYVNGQTRDFDSNGDIVCNANFSDGTTGLVQVTGGNAFVAITSGVSADFWIPGAVFGSYNNPCLNDSAFDAFLTTLQTGPGGITAANNLAIFDDSTSGSGQLIAQTGTAAPGTAAIFLTLSDPVYNNNEAIAFRGTLKVAAGQATATTATGIWADDSTPNSLALIARQGDQAPGCPVGATFATFTELVLPDQGGGNNRGGVVFLGTLNANAAAGVTTANNTGIWAVDANGTLQLIARTGVVLNGKTVTTLTFLPSPVLVNGTSRGFAQSSGDLVYMATFTDKSTAIFNVQFQ